MPRKYSNIAMYKKEIFELRKQGLTNREIGKRFGFSLEQIEQFLKRERRKDEKGHADLARPTLQHIQLYPQVCT